MVLLMLDGPREREKEEERGWGGASACREVDTAELMGLKEERGNCLVEYGRGETVLREGEKGRDREIPDQEPLQKEHQKNANSLIHYASK